MPFSYASVIDAGSPHDWSAERLKLVIEAARIGTFDFDLVTGALVWSEQCKKLFGLPVDIDVTYERFLETLHPADREATDAAVRRSLDPQGDGTYHAEYRVVHADGAVRWIAAEGRSYFEIDGERSVPIRMLGTVLDITDRKIAEATMREQAERQQAALLASNTGTFRWNLASDQLDWDQSLSRLFGLEDAGAVSSFDAFVALVHPDDRAAVARALPGMRDDGRRLRHGVPHRPAGRRAALAARPGRDASPTRPDGRPT